MKRNLVNQSAAALSFVVVLQCTGCATNSSAPGPQPTPVAPSNPTSGNDGSNTAPNQPSTPVSSLPSTLPQAAPTAVETSGRGVQTWLKQVNKPYANQLGSGNGQGVTVGVVDSGVQVNHPELNGRVIDSLNVFNDSKDVKDEIGHGTHVSGIISGTSANGAPFEGVAPGANLVMAKAFATNTTSTTDIEKGIDWVVNNKAVPILSLSLGTSVPAMQASISNAVQKGVLVVAALGNNGLRSGASWPAEFAKESWANGQIIAVGAVDSNNQIASFSNVDSSLANWTVVAPGVNVASSYSVPGQQNAYSFMSGTSMATPIVAGQAALLKSNWAFLNARDLASIIFITAKRICSDNADATVCGQRKVADPVYGWGLVDIAASLQPVGELALSTKSGEKIAYAGSKLATPKSGIASGLKGLNTIALDSFNRGFVVNLDTAVGSTKGGMSAVPVLPSASNNATSALGFKLASSGAQTRELLSSLETTSYSPLNLTASASAFSAPFSGLLNDATQVAYGFQLQSNWTVRLNGAVQGTDSRTPRKLATGIELTHAKAGTASVFSVGKVNENASILGLTGSGAMAIDSEANTTYLSIASSFPTSNAWRMSALLAVGLTESLNNKAKSLLTSTSDTSSLAWSLGMERKGNWVEGDTLSFAVSMPLRTTSGKGTLSLASSQNQSTGELVFEDKEFDLAPTGYQTNWDIAYMRPISRTSRVGALFQTKFQPGHQSNTAPQWSAGVRFESEFK